MSLAPQISVVKLERMTRFAPLVALGFYVREHDLLAPLYSRLEFGQPMHTKEPQEAIVDLWISMLAGCRSVSQINTKIRPDRPLAMAWGRDQFKEQSTIARVLDGCQSEQVQQVREAGASLYRWIGQAPRHPTTAPLLVDIDLTGLPAGRQAQGSLPGYGSGKRGSVCANYVESAPPPMARVSAPCSIRAIR